MREISSPYPVLEGKRRYWVNFIVAMSLNQLCKTLIPNPVSNEFLLVNASPNFENLMFNKALENLITVRS